MVEVKKKAKYNWNPFYYQMGIMTGVGGVVSGLLTANVPGVVIGSTALAGSLLGNKTRKRVKKNIRKLRGEKRISSKYSDLLTKSS